MLPFGRSSLETLFNIFLHFLSDTIFRFASCCFMRLIIIFICLFLVLTLKALAQQTFKLRGVVSKRLSGERIAQVVINDLRSHDFIESDNVGWFAINVAIGDTLLFSKADYTPQKIVITAIADIPVYMQPVVKLDEVQIKGQTKRQELNDVMNDYRKKGTFYDGKPPALSFLTSPITGLYELFGKTPGQARRFAKDSKNELEYAEVHRRYNTALIKRVTHASDSTAQKFMNYYTPSFEDLKQWNDYELIRRIRKSYDYYAKNSDKEGLEKLNLPPLVHSENKKLDSNSDR